MLVLLAVAFATPRVDGPRTLDWRLAQVARGQGFDLWSWEVDTVARRSGAALFDPTPADRPDTVRRYAALSRAMQQSRAERDRLWAKRAVTGSAPDLPDVQRRLDDQNRALARLRPTVEATLSQEIAAELRRQGIAPGSYGLVRATDFPFLRPRVIPPVFFQIGPLPDLLVVAPVDRIELIGSVLIQPNLPPRQIDDLERRADGLGVSSVVTGIGGLAAYPSLLPDTGSTKELLVAIAHEWTHHYLVFRPLGMRYFDTYAMREINETVADMVGNEVGTAVFDGTYRPSAPPSPPPTAPPPTQPTRPDFVSEMRRIRVTVEGYLARHDVAGADAYMAEQQKRLAREGYYVRRLNTAYLSFFGSYSGSANPYEAKLRRLRAREPNLGAFLRTVATVRQPSDLDRLLASPRPDAH